MNFMMDLFVVKRFVVYLWGCIEKNGEQVTDLTEASLEIGNFVSFLPYVSHIQQMLEAL